MCVTNFWILIISIHTSRLGNMVKQIWQPLLFINGYLRMEYTLFQDFAHKIMRPAPPTSCPGRAQSGRTKEFGYRPWRWGLKLQLIHISLLMWTTCFYLPEKWLYNRIYCTSNQSKQIKETHTDYSAGTQYTRQSLNEKTTTMASQTDGYRLWSHVWCFSFKLCRVNCVPAL